MSLTGLQRQEELVYGEDNSIKNFPMSSKIKWEDLYPTEEQTWAHRFGFRKNVKISHCGEMVKEAYEAVEKVSQEYNVPVAKIWEQLNRYKPTNGFMFNSDIESAYQILDKYITLADSGSAYAGTMRTIQWVAQKELVEVNTIIKSLSFSWSIMHKLEFLVACVMEPLPGTFLETRLILC